VNVLESGEPVSTMKTCGACHDTDFIAQHSYHADLGLSEFGEAAATDHPWDSSSGYFGNWNAIDYRYLSPAGDEFVDLTTPDWIRQFGVGLAGGGPLELSRDGSTLLEALRASATNPEAATLDEEGELQAWNWRQSGTVEMDCFVCHLESPDNAARESALQAGDFAWANTATLNGTGIGVWDGDEWTWSEEAFQANGELAREFISVQDPSDTNCAACHGVVHDEPNELLTADTCDDELGMSYTTGQVISAARISNSGTNIADKAELNRSWDIHAERLVACVDCHYALNNPVFSEARAEESLEHLTFDPRRLDMGAYLAQPLHEFARTDEAATLVPGESAALQACESCHDPEPVHAWLPYTERHMEALACETCHVPQLFAPSARQIDWTVLQPDSEPRRDCRGLDGSEIANPLVSSYSPVLMQTERLDGSTELAPFNLVSAWYWVYGDPARPVRLIDLEAAWLVDGDYSSEVLAAFDGDGNGEIDGSELAILTEEQETLIAGRLEALGLENPRIVGEVQPYSINHGIAGGEWAIRDCQTCHTSDSKLAQSYTVASYLPGGVLPEFIGSEGSGSGSLIVGDDGSLSYSPLPAEDGYYVLGHENVTWVDWFGVLAFIGTFLGVIAHGGMRVMAARRLPKTGGKTKRVYMYGIYERLWHWLQSFTILLLLVTGLVIHKPAMFGFLSFGGVVLVHNILAGILVVNAALALFFHLASGEIKQYIPRPAGFFSQAIEQAVYYTRGIFKGATHPFEKTQERKLNPLQQVTYLGLLNVLLPLQIITGIVIWGAQRWPQLAQALGGLPFLGPVHTIIAWLLASFIVMHVYLTTTAGETPVSGIRSMVMGWEDVEVHGPDTKE
jgi:thiosulfate reductase cytochrome b subunit